jgi:hypothetical protein
VYCRQKGVYWVVVNTSGGQTKALKGTDRDFMKRVARTLTDAIVSRG